MQNRLRLTGGVRFENTKAEARGLHINNNAAYMKYADGSVVHLGDLDANGASLVQNLGTSTNVNYVLTQGPALLPATRAGAPIFLPNIQAAGNAARAAGESTDTNANLGRGTLAHTAAVYTRLGAVGESETSEFFPSLHASYNFSENIVLQVGYARTQAKNRFDRSIIPHNEITENSLNATSALGRINVRNKNLEPWIGDNFEARLSYYNATGGVIGVGVFHKIIDNYQRDIISEPLTLEEATALAADFPELGIGPEFAGYELRTWQNVGTAKINGLEIEARQSLDTFLPDWARGFLLRGSMAFTELRDQPAGGDFNNLRDKRFTLNVGYSRGKFSANVGYIMNGLVTNNGEITSNGRIGIQQTVPQHLVDFNVNYAITRWARLFISGNNIFDELRAREDRYDERPTYAEMGSSNTFGITFTAGITGTF
jgi:outer membrane receptor protein involved in Fe transport